MITVEIVEARAAHVGELIRGMRSDDRAEIVALGGHPRHTPFALYRDSFLCRAALVDGAVAAVWGLQGHALADEAEPWLFTTAQVERDAVRFVRIMRAEVGRLLEGRMRLTTRVAADYQRSIDTFRMLGFRIGPVVAGRWREMRMERAFLRFPPDTVYCLPGQDHVCVTGARPEHMANLAMGMRQADVDEFARHGLTPLQALDGALRHSTMAWVGMAWGEPLCLFGVIPPMGGEPARPWLIASAGLFIHWRAFLRLNLALLPRMLELHGHLADTVDARNTTSLRWLRWLGFEVAPAMVVGEAGDMMHTFRMEA